MTMRPAQAHLEWLRFVEPSGPFLSLPVLMRAWPQGFEALPPGKRDDLRERLDEWRAATSNGQPDLAVHRQWCLLVLRDLLGWPAECLREAGTGTVLPTARAPLGRETLAPDLALLNPPAQPAGSRVLVQILPPGSKLDTRQRAHAWAASAQDRMVELLRGTGVRLGLITNGHDWWLVQLGAGELPGVAHWDVDLWFDERGTLEAFAGLLAPTRFFAVATSDTLEVLLDESREQRQELTRQLGHQVRRAVEVLVQAIDRADRDTGGHLLVHVAPVEAYDAALTVMMRLVFLFAAEERDLIGQGQPIYEQYYAVSTLREHLQEAADQHGEEVLETRLDAWGRLLATFRLIHGGAVHEGLSLPGYGGSLFDPDRYPFLEGRTAGTSWRTTAAEPLPITNRTVLHLLSALQEIEVTSVGAGREKRRLSFRELGIEDVGHVYEGLLDHTARRAQAPNAPVLGLAGPDEPEIALPALEELRARGSDALCIYLSDETGRSRKAIERALTQPVLHDEAGARRACGQDAALYERVKPWLGLVRDDTLQQPVIVREGSVYVTAGADRRSTGTHYTPRTLTEMIVQHALEPVVYAGPAEGLPPAAWTLRPARELLALKICDFAMGSGAFLVQACRYLGERLVESWAAAERALPGGAHITPEGERSMGEAGERLIPQDPDERLIVATRLVADRCLYGVDRNPMAVEMAKLSLWLVTLQKDRPFNFLDHALRCGDSLLGVTSLQQLEYFDLSPAGGQQVDVLTALARPAIAGAAEKRRELESFPVLSSIDSEHKAALLAEADARLAELRAVANLLVGSELAGYAQGGNRDAELGSARDRVAALFDVHLTRGRRLEMLDALRALAETRLNRGKPAAQPSRRPFHWVLEFPEVFERGGFDALVANPPFQGGQKITGVLGTDYRRYLVHVAAGGQRGSADLSAYFMLRLAPLLLQGGTLGMIATNTIAQGDTREVGMDQLLRDGYVCPRAHASQKWPGDANLEVAIVWLRRGEWQGAFELNGASVAGITASLSAPGRVAGKPLRLGANSGKSFQGSIVLGMGFVLAPDEARTLLERDARNRDVLFPYLNGEDLNSRWDQSPSRWVINFRDWPLDRASAPSGYVGPVATDYPECLRIVEAKVRPERQKLAKGDATARDRARRWWQFGRPTIAMYAAIGKLERLVGLCLVTQYFAPSLLPNGQIFAHRLCMFASDAVALYALVQSTIHEVWAREHSSSLETRLNYSPSDCFETFAFPSSLDSLATFGERYDACRRLIMIARRDGLTVTYGRFHSANVHDADIEQLRALHADLDRAVAAAYGWSDIDLEHGFHETKQGTRYTISESARRRTLDLLLELNHVRHAAELAEARLEGAPSTAGRAKRPPRTHSGSTPPAPNLFEP